MTFGVDQCRVCGKPITPSNGLAMHRYQESLRKKPTMTEKQWRAAGLKAMPTRLQMTRRIDGCCYDCALPLGLSALNPYRLLIPLVLLILLFGGLVFFVTARFT